MTLRIVFLGQFSASAKTNNFMDIANVDSWSTSGNLLCIVKNDERVVYLPLSGILSFSEVQNEQAADA